MTGTHHQRDRIDRTRSRRRLGRLDEPAGVDQHVVVARTLGPGRNLVAAFDVEDEDIAAGALQRSAEGFGAGCRLPARGGADDQQRRGVIEQLHLECACGAHDRGRR